MAQTDSSSQQYLEESEYNILMENMLAEALRCKPDDYVKFAIEYFEMVRTHRQVLGKGFESITSCNYNRRSFAYWLVEACRGYPEKSSITFGEMCLIIELICPDFRRNLVREASVVSTVSVERAEAYELASFKASIIFHVIYGQWLEEAEKVFKQLSVLDRLRVEVIIDRVHGLKQSLPSSISVPDIIDLDSAERKIIELRLEELSYNEWKRVVIHTNVKYFPFN